MIGYIIAAGVGLFALSKLNEQQTAKPTTTQTVAPAADTTPAPNRTDITSAPSNLAASFLLYRKYILPNQLNTTVAAATGGGGSAPAGGGTGGGSYGGAGGGGFGGAGSRGGTLKGG